MVLHSRSIGTVPFETERIARAAFPKKNLYIQMRDEIGTIFEDQDFACVYADCGQPAESPWRLVLVLIMQFIEGLTDRQAAEAVRARMDWKYLLGLELTDPGFDYSVLSEFRERLVTGGIEEVILNKMLEQFQAKELVKARGKQRTDSTHVLAAVRKLNRLEAVGETLRAALNELAAANPQWLKAQVTAEWFERYGRRIEDYRLPKGEEARAAYATQIGIDGQHLLNALADQSTPAELRELDLVKTLRLMWQHQYEITEQQIHWRAAADLPPAGVRFDSPYDPEAHFGNKRATTWTGYKVHLTETCDEESVHLITQVTTTSAVLPDVSVSEPIQQALSEKQLLPAEHLVDGGYVDAQFLIESQQQRNVTVIGPVRPNVQWQKRTGTGFDITHFKIDWQNKTVTCPAGVTTNKWYPDKNSNGEQWIDVRFKTLDCRDCSLRSQCTKAKNAAREIRIRPKEQHQMLQLIRQQQTTPEWKQQYNLRAGVEGTLSQGIRAFELRQSRYLGQAKTHLHHILIAAAINIVRVIDWLNQVVRAKTRVSRFASLATLPDLS